MFSSAKFEVTLNVERISRFPYMSGTLQVRWNAGDSTHIDGHGHTPYKEVLMTEAQFKHETKFTKKIGLRSTSRELRDCMCRFEVIWRPIGGKEVSVGTMSLNLSEFARPAGKKGKLAGLKNAAGTDNDEEVFNKCIVYTLRSRTNSLLALRVALEYISGDDDYVVPKFSGPACTGTNNIGASLGDNEARITERVNNLRDAVGDALPKDSNDTYQDPRWYDLDELLMGNTVRIIPPAEFAEFKKQGIRPPPADDSSHKRGTPYSETEIRESFVTWKIS